MCGGKQKEAGAESDPGYLHPSPLEILVIRKITPLNSQCP